MAIRQRNQDLFQSSQVTPIREQTTIPVPVDVLWPLLADPASVVKCIPGAALEAQRPDGAYPASITVKFGPTIAKFTGEVRVAYDHAAHRCTVEGRGIDGRGASNALVTATVSLDGTTAPVLTVDGGFSVSGPLETFASAGGVHVARALLAEFATNVAQLAKPQPPAGATATPQTDASTAKPLSGGRLLWQAFLGWIRQLTK
jgi:uncharacterized protein